MGGTHRPIAWQEDSPTTQVELPPAVESAFDSFLIDRFPRATLPRLRASIDAMSGFFTSERSDLPGAYLNQPEARSAYLSFFHPQQVLRGVAAMQEVKARAERAGVLPAGRELVRVLDLGAGVGAMSQAALITGLVQAQRVEFTLVDHQKSALADARELTLRVATGLAGDPPPEGWQKPLVRTASERVQAWTEAARRAGWRYDVILLGGVLNEIRGEWSPLFGKILSLLDPAAPGGGVIVVVEPAIPAVARTLQALRDHFLRATTTLAPCLHAAQCPLLGFSKDWCFTVRKVRLPRFVRDEATRLGHQNHEVRFAVWAATGRVGVPLPAPGSAARVITDPVPGGQVLCLDGEKARMPEDARPLRRGAIVVR